MSSPIQQNFEISPSDIDRILEQIESDSLQLLEFDCAFENADSIDDFELKIWDGTTDDLPLGNPSNKCYGECFDVVFEGVGVITIPATSGPVVRQRALAANLSFNDKPYEINTTKQVSNGLGKAFITANEEGILNGLWINPSLEIDTQVTILHKIMQLDRLPFNLPPLAFIKWRDRLKEQPFRSVIAKAFPHMAGLRGKMAAEAAEAAVDQDRFSLKTDVFENTFGLKVVLKIGKESKKHLGSSESDHPEAVTLDIHSLNFYRTLHHGGNDRKLLSEVSATTKNVLYNVQLNRQVLLTRLKTWREKIFGI